MTEGMPQQISKYRIKGLLGQGAMGIVYLGHDEQIDRKVAIKTIAAGAKTTSADADFVARFVQEAKLLAKCKHPNIVTILDFGQQDQMAYMVMEYIKGPSLKDLLKKQRSIPLLKVMSMFVQLLKALHVAHQNGIIHRDLKPENVLLENAKALKLTDFGIAKSDENQNMTQIGVAVGTPRYMAPEQMFGSDEVGTFTDVYSLFVMLYELLGHVKDIELFDGAVLPQLNQMAKHNQFNSKTLIPVVLHEFMHKGLSVGYKDRFASVQEVVSALKPLMNSLKQTTGTVTPSPVEDETSGFFTTGTVITQTATDWVINDEDFAGMRDHLADLIGPMADFILTHALKQSHSQDQFIMQIAEKLDNQAIRESFIDRWRTY